MVHNEEKREPLQKKEQGPAGHSETKSGEALQPATSGTTIPATEAVVIWAEVRKAVQERFGVASRGFEVQADGFNAHEIGDGQEVEDGGQKGSGDNRQIADPRKIRHDESACAHHRWHELSARGGRGLHACGEAGGKPAFAHERDRDDTGGNRVGDGRSADGPHHA